MKKIVYKKWFKILIILVTFLPIITMTKYNPQDTQKIIGSVLANPFINYNKIVLIIAKWLLFIVSIMPFILKKKSEKIVLSYYFILLILTGIFQNMAYTEYGFTFIIGNFIVQFIVSGFVLYDIVKKKTTIDKECVDMKKLWILPLMLLAFFMPYAVVNNVVIPSINNVLVNESGVTYCMITPIIIGLMIIFNKKVYKPTLNIVSFLGLSFGIFNIMSWFMVNYQNWWMGILHFPLLVISIYGVRISKKED